MRVTMSVPPPAPNPTSMRIGFCWPILRGYRSVYKSRGDCSNSDDAAHEVPLLGSVINGQATRGDAALSSA